MIHFTIQKISRSWKDFTFFLLYCDAFVGSNQLTMCIDGCSRISNIRILIGIPFREVDGFHKFAFTVLLEYRKVASRSTSRLVVRPRIFRLFMKGKFDPYALWPLALDLGPLNSRPVYYSRLYGIYKSRTLKIYQDKELTFLWIHITTQKSIQKPGH